MVSCLIRVTFINMEPVGHLVAQGEVGSIRRSYQNQWTDEREIYHFICRVPKRAARSIGLYNKNKYKQLSPHIKFLSTPALFRSSKRGMHKYPER